MCVGFGGDNHITAVAVLAFGAPADTWPKFQLHWVLRRALGINVYLTYIKKITRAGIPIYGIEIPLTDVNKEPQDIDGYKMLAAVAKHYGLDPPLVQLALDVEDDVFHSFLPVVGEDDAFEDESGDCHLVEGLEHLLED
jgi:hypothetical protein